MPVYKARDSGQTRAVGAVKYARGVSHACPTTSDGTCVSEAAAKDYTIPGVALGTRTNNTSHGAVRGKENYCVLLQQDTCHVQQAERCYQDVEQKETKTKQDGTNITYNIKVKNKRFLISLNE